MGNGSLLYEGVVKRPTKERARRCLEEKEKVKVLQSRGGRKSTLHFADVKKYSKVRGGAMMNLQWGGDTLTAFTGIPGDRDEKIRK